MRLHLKTLLPFSPRVRCWMCKDSHVTKEYSFPLSSFYARQQHQSKNIVLMLHGFNEKSWSQILYMGPRIAQSNQQSCAATIYGSAWTRLPWHGCVRRGTFAASEQWTAHFALPHPLSIMWKPSVPGCGAGQSTAFCMSGLLWLLVMW